MNANLNYGQNQLKILLFQKEILNNNYTNIGTYIKYFRFNFMEFPF